jgi:hypothetical protein
MNNCFDISNLRELEKRLTKGIQRANKSQCTLMKRKEKEKTDEEVKRGKKQ